MGVYIPNMEKPKHCTECYFVCRDQCELQDNSYDYDTFKEQKRHCPLQKIDLVRCGECRKWREEDGERFCGISELLCSANDFCSYGERKGGDNMRDDRTYITEPYMSRSPKGQIGE